MPNEVSNKAGKQNNIEHEALKETSVIGKPRKGFKNLMVRLDNARYLTQLCVIQVIAKIFAWEDW